MSLIDKNIVGEYSKRFKAMVEYNFYVPPTTTLQEDDDANPTDTPTGDGAPMSQMRQDTIQPDDTGIDDTAGELSDETPVGEDDGVEEIDLGDDFNDDTVEIDVTSLTDSQEETNNQIAQLTQNFQQFTDFADKITQAIDLIGSEMGATKSQIEDLGKEIVQRNPTEIEKLNMRSQDSFPFNQRIDDFWDEKARENPNYEIRKDNTPNKEVEYILTQDDIDNEPISARDPIMYRSFGEGLNKSLGELLNLK